jgi:hypothetical protein
MKFFFIIFISLILIISSFYYVQAYVATSTNYRIQFQSLNVGGEDFQTSTNYRLSDTIGEIATGISTSTLYKLKAGYRQMSEVFISISSPADITMSPSISGITGGTASASTSWTVITDNPAGFSLSIRSTSAPSMILDANWNFSDYTPSTANVPDYHWQSPPSGQAEFGFTVEPETPADTVQLFKDDGTNCNTGTLNTVDMCWLNASTTNVTIVNRSNRTDSNGEDEKVKFKTESNGKFLKEGNYTATIIVTAVVN